MCGIIGYTGQNPAAEILLSGLEKLEYRGYDSAGICIQTENGLAVEKTVGRVSALRRLLEGKTHIAGRTGIGHTRWATHGVPSVVNSHPHLSDTGKIAVVHNGIIENESELRAWLLERGHAFRSETDTEVIANLIGHYYSLCHDFLASVRSTVSRLKGSFALGILCEDVPRTLIAAMEDSPLAVGIGEGEYFVASDVTAFAGHTNRVAYLKNGDLAVIEEKSVLFYDSCGVPVQKKIETVLRESSDSELGTFPHFMLKEIYEQPKAVEDTVNGCKDSGITLQNRLKNPERIYLVGCGSAYYAALWGKYIIGKICAIPAETVVASEFRYGCPAIGPKDLVVAISQSGETADTLAALKEAKRRGAHTLAVVNVDGSAIAKYADDVLYTRAGPEIAVATTKAFSCQLCVLLMIALSIGDAGGTLKQEEHNAAAEALQNLPDQIRYVLRSVNVEKIQRLADCYCDRKDAYFIGRDTDCPICFEASLKLKEVAYLHSEAYPAGELKHGPIAMIEKGTLVVALATSERLFDKTMANIREVEARGAEVLCVTVEERETQARAVADHVVTVPATHPLLQSALAIVPLQLFAYFMALNRGCDVDKPRNLAKSVTVE